MPSPRHWTGPLPTFTHGSYTTVRPLRTLVCSSKPQLFLGSKLGLSTPSPVSTFRHQQPAQTHRQLASISLSPTVNRESQGQLQAFPSEEDDGPERSLGEARPSFHRRREVIHGKDLDWTNALRNINASYSRHVSARFRKVRLSRVEIEAAAPGYCRLTRNRLKRRHLRLRLRSLDAAGKGRHMRSILLLALRDSPESAIYVLHDLLDCTTLDVPAHIVKDVMKSIGCAFIAKVRQQRSHPASHNHQRSIELMLATTRCAIQHWADRYPSMIGHDLLCALIWRLRDPQLKQLIDLIIASACNVNTRTLCVFIQRYLQIGNHRRCIWLLKQIPQADRGHGYVQRTCISLLTQKFLRATPRLTRLRLDLARQVLRLGVRLDSALRNAVIRVAAEAEERDLARHVFHATNRGPGASADAGTIRALLCGNAIGVGEVHWILDRAEEHNLVNMAIANQAMIAIDRSQRFRSRGGGRPLDDAFTVYARLFNVRPLVDLGLLQSTSAFAAQQAGSLQLKPRSSTMATIVRAYCDQFSGSMRLWHAYQRYVHHAKSGHRIFRVCATQPYISEFFMLGMRDNPAMLGHCVQVLLNMLDPSGSGRASGTGQRFENDEIISDSSQLLTRISLAVRNAQSIDQLRHAREWICPPRTLTWSILISAALNAGETDMASKVVSLLQELKLPTSTVAWNTLLSYYAAKQDIDEIVTVIQKMDASGEEADLYTKRALSRINDRRALIAALDRAVQRRNGNLVSTTTDLDLSANFADDLAADELDNASTEAIDIAAMQPNHEATRNSTWMQPDAIFRYG